MQASNKKKYKAKLEEIQYVHRKNFENFFKAWGIKYYPKKRIAALLFMFVDLLIAKELHQLNNEKGGNDEQNM